MEDSVYVFSIDVADTAKVKKFKRQHRNCHMGMTADKFSYTFCPTSLGTAITVECSCGQKILLGDFIDHDDAEYDEDKHKTLTKQDLDNQKFEDAALRIIRLKNPRIYRMCTMKEQSFEVIYSFAVGVAAFADERISKAILYKCRLDNMKNVIQNYHGNDSEKIKLFYEHFEKNIRSEIKKYNCKNQQLLDELDKEN